MSRWIFHLCFVKLEPLSTLSLLLLVLLEQIFLLSSPQCQTLTTTWELPENWVQRAETINLTLFGKGPSCKPTWCWNELIPWWFLGQYTPVVINFSHKVDQILAPLWIYKELPFKHFNFNRVSKELTKSSRYAEVHRWECFQSWMG